MPWKPAGNADGKGKTILILKRITEIKNIAGVIVVNSDGITVKSTLENSLSVQVNNLLNRII